MHLCRLKAQQTQHSHSWWRGAVAVWKFICVVRGCKGSPPAMGLLFVHRAVSMGAEKAGANDIIDEVEEGRGPEV